MLRRTMIRGYGQFFCTHRHSQAQVTAGIYSVGVKKGPIRRNLLLYNIIQLSSFTKHKQYVKEKVEWRSESATRASVNMCSIAPPAGSAQPIAGLKMVVDRPRTA